MGDESEVMYIEDFKNKTYRSDWLRKIAGMRHSPLINTIIECGISDDDLLVLFRNIKLIWDMCPKTAPFKEIAFTTLFVKVNITKEYVSPSGLTPPPKGASPFGA